MEAHEIICLGGRIVDSTVHVSLSLAQFVTGDIGPTREELIWGQSLRFGANNLIVYFIPANKMYQYI